MKTLQEQYNLIQEGKGSKHIFLKEAKSKFPNMITNAATFEETAQILKNRSVISETLGGVVSLQPVTPLESNTKENFEIAFANFLAEEAKVEEKKATKEVEEAETAGYDYKNLKELDNQIGHEVLKGIYFEGRQNPDKTLEELRDMVAKNLAKDQLHYKKNAYFGIEGLGLEEMKSEEVSGKHKSSGYSDKLKSLVKESLGAVISNVPVFEQNLTEIESDIVAYIADVYIQNAKGGDRRFDEFRDLNIRDAVQDVVGILRSPQHPLHQETKKEYEIVKADKARGLFEEEVKEEAQPYSDENRKEEAEGLAADIGLEGSDAQNFISRLMKATDGKSWDQFYDIADDIMPQFMSEGNEAEKETKPKKKMKKETIETKLAEIEKAGKVTTLEAQIAAVEEAIAQKQERLNLVNEDSEMAELLDKGKVNAMRKEIKVLEKRCGKMQKMYEKMCGKAYQKPITDDMELGGEAPAFE